MKNIALNHRKQYYDNFYWKVWIKTQGERSSEVLKATTNTGGIFLFLILLKFGRHKFEPDSAHHTKFQLNRS